MKNYRPVSNLSFLSKILEKVVLRQLSNHLLTNNLFYSHQSAYRAGHSTGPFSRSSMTFSLLSMKTNFLSCLCLICLLPLILLTTQFFCHVLVTLLVYLTVLAWFTSYLTDRTQTIFVNGSKSLPAPLHYGVPQGSVLGPILFVLYTQPFSKIIQQHSLYTSPQLF